VRYLPQQHWHEVRPGTVVLSFDGMPRAVISNIESPRVAGVRILLLEGMPEPLYARAYHYAQPVELDTADAIGNFFTAGFTVTPIGE
jgi:hypothetical protein